MTEVHFYHLQRQSLDAVLPALLTRSRERGWRALVKLATPDRMAALDDHLWSYSDESFLAHGAETGGDVADQPVLLTLGDANPNGAAMLVVAEGASLPPALEGYERVALVFDGQDEAGLAAARETWRRLKGEAAHVLAYHQQDEEGRWRRMA